MAKAYASIPHLPGSRVGGDRHVHEAQARWCTEAGSRPVGAVVTVEEKLDGSCVVVARDGGAIVALGREGRPAAHSPNAARRMFARWVERQRARFEALLDDGERAVGEWLALAHGTRYALSHEPFVLFDLMRGEVRLEASSLRARAHAHGFTTPHVLHQGGGVSVERALALLGPFGHHGASDGAEGVVYRVAVGGAVKLVAKCVRTDKIDGRLLPENTGLPPVWNYHDGLDDPTP